MRNYAIYFFDTYGPWILGAFAAIIVLSIALTVIDWFKK